MNKFYGYFSVLFLFSFYISQGQTTTITNTGSLNVPRWLHESQVLSNGKVLAFGGDNGNYQSLVVYNSAELYDPGTGTWSYTGSMNARRVDFASVVLNNGNVLAIGGQDENQNTYSSCELYNASTGTWSVIAPMQLPRTDHEAVLLRNGKVLVAAGTVNDARCELYDPVSNTWSYTGSLNVPHGKGVSMTMLSDGRILLTGGVDAQKTGEIYDPAYNTWTKIVASMSKNRYYHSSVLRPNGQVMIIGSSSVSYQDQISVEYYSPTSNAFISPNKTLAVNVGKSDMIILDNGNILAYGIGDFFNPTDTRCLQEYDISSGIWNAGTYGFVGTNAYTIHKLNNGQILIIGGSFTTGNGSSALCKLVNQGYATCVPANLSFSVTGGSACAGKDVNISMTNSEAGVSYQAYLANGLSVGNAVNGSGSISLTVPSDALLTGKNTVLVKASKTGCPIRTLNDTAWIQVNQVAVSAPVVTLSGPASFCTGSSVTLTAPFAAGYSWSNGATTQQISINQSGFFSVKTYDASGCTSPSSADVQTLLYPATISAGTNESICQAAPAITLAGFSPAGGTWSGTGVSAAGVFNPALSGTGTFTLTYSLCSQTATKTITVNATTVLNDYTSVALKDSVCWSLGTTINILNSTSGVYYNCLMGSTYLGGGNLAGNGGTLSFNTGSLNATTTFKVTAFKIGTCGSPEIVHNHTVKVLPNPTAHVVVTKDTICSITPAVFKVAQSDPTYRYRIQGWGAYVRGNGDTLSLQGPAYLLADDTEQANYTITIEATNNLTCQVVPVSTKKITSFNHLASMQLQENYLLSETVKVVNTSNGDTYKWNFGNSSIPSASILKNPTWSYSTTGVKRIQLISTSRFGCIDTSNHKTYVHEPIAVAPGKSCFFDTLTTRAEQADYRLNNYMAMHMDAANNSYLSNYLYVTSGYPTSFNCILQKNDPAGNLLWQLTNKASTFGSDTYRSSFITGIKTDPSGNIYVCGNFGIKSSAFKMAGLTTKTFGIMMSRAFVMKLNSDGVGQWIIYSTSEDGGHDAHGATDILYVDDQHIYFSTCSENKLHFPDNTDQIFPTNGLINVVQIDKDGKFKKVFSDNGSAAYYGIESLYYPNITVETGLAAAIGPKLMMSEQGKIYAFGKYTGSMTFGSTVINSSEYRSGFVAKMDTVLGWQSAFNTHSIKLFYPSMNSTEFRNYENKVTIDENNNFYVTDYYETYYNPEKQPDDATMSKIVLPNGVELADTSGSFIAKYDANGNIVWYNHNTVSYPVGIKYLKSTGDIVSYGHFNKSYYTQSSQSGLSKAIASTGKQDIFISALGSNGNVKWLDKIGSKEDDEAIQMLSNSCSELILFGKLRARGGIKGDTLFYSNKSLFLSRYAPTGTCATPCNPVNLPLKVSIASLKDNNINVSPIPVTVKFTRPVSGFDQSDLIVSNATISSFAGSGDTYTLLLTPVTSAAVTMKIAAGAATDGTLSNLESNLFRMLFDNVKPSIVLTTPKTYFNVTSFNVTLTTSEPLVNFDATDLKLTNCTLQSFDKSSTLVYSAILNTSAEGLIKVVVPQGIVTDSAANSNNASNELNIYYDITKPTAVITSAATVPTNISPIPLVITFSEPVTGLAASAFSNTSITNISNPSGDQKTYTANFNLSSTTNSTIWIKSGYLYDLAGNTNLISNSLPYYYDISKPSVSITTPASLTATNPIPFRASFSKKVFGISTASFTVTNGTITSITQAGTVYNLLVAPTASGVVTVKMLADMVADTLGTKNVLSNTASTTYDGDKPTVVIASVRPNPTNATTIPITFTFSENVTDFTLSDLFVTNGTLSAFTGSNKNYSVTLTPNNVGLVTLRFLAGAVKDAALNTNDDSPVYFNKFDNVKPNVTLTSTSASTTSDVPIKMTITFSEPVTGLTLSDFIVINATLSNLAGSGAVYTVDMTPTASGSILIRIPSDAAADAAGNTCGSSNYFTITYTNVDTTKPSLVITSAVSGTTNQSSILFTFTFSENVTGFTASDIVLNNAMISGFSGSGYTYTAMISPIAEGPLTVTVPADALTDGSSNGNTVSTFTIQYDITAPQATISTSSSNPAADPLLHFTIVFSESVTGLTSSDFTVMNGALSNLSGSGTAYAFDVTAFSSGLVTVQLNTGAAIDDAGNGNSSTSTSVTYTPSDHERPQLVISSTVTTATNQASIPLTFTFTEDVTGFTAAGITTSNAVLSNFSGSGNTYTALLTFNTEGATSINVADNVAFDAASNGNTLASFSIDYDLVHPQGMMTTNSSNPTSDAVIHITITFTEIISDLSLSSFVVTNGTLSDLVVTSTNLRTSGVVYTFDLHPSSIGMVTVALDGYGATDLAGNGLEPLALEIEYTDVVTSISNPQSSSYLEVFPNPLLSEVTLTLHLKEDAVGSLSWCDISGNVLTVLKDGLIEKDSRHTFILYDYPAGMYLLKLVTDQGTIIKKISKQ